VSFIKLFRWGVRGRPNRTGSCGSLLVRRPKILAADDTVTLGCTSVQSPVPPQAISTHLKALSQHAQPLSSHNTPTLFISQCSHPLSPDGFRLASDIIYLQHQFLAASASAINKKPVASEDVCPPPTRLLIVLVCQFSEAAHAKVVFTNQQRTFQGLAIVISTLLPSTPL
jgi:hypothetical protein